MAALWGCGASSSGEEEGAKTEQVAKAKGKRKHFPRSKKGKAKPMDPVGAAGPVVGSLSLKEVPVTDPEGGEATEETRTEAKLALTFGEDGTAEVDLGSIKGKCAEVERVPVGPKGKEQTPLWSIQCGEGDKSANLYVQQVGSMLLVVRAFQPLKEGAPVRYRPVKRIPMVDGAKLERGG
ncbi:MAG: hypothetical protein KTR31_17955 [Myxococcales bacterium]|nr:hypothetical protein [Myxococcales bacterium]